MWFDGATGGDHRGYYGGANALRTIDNAQTYYDIPNLRDSIHNTCPDIILWGVGGEARWIGNEAGWAGETNWAMGDAHRGIRGVHALAARTRRLEGVDTDIGVRNIDVIGGFHERNHLDRGEGCRVS